MDTLLPTAVCALASVHLSVSCCPSNCSQTFPGSTCVFEHLVFAQPRGWYCQLKREDCGQSVWKWLEGLTDWPYLRGGHIYSRQSVPFLHSSFPVEPIITTSLHRLWPSFPLGKFGALGSSGEWREMEGQSSAHGHPWGVPSCSSVALCLSRDPSVDPREEEEESEGPPREQDLKGTYIQLVRGVQEWQDGSVYRGEFGLNMKLGYGEFSWPTGEVGGVHRGLSPEGRCCEPSKRPIGWGSGFLQENSRGVLCTFLYHILVFWGSCMGFGKLWLEKVSSYSEWMFYYLKCFYLSMYRFYLEHIYPILHSLPPPNMSPSHLSVLSLSLFKIAY